MVGILHRYTAAVECNASLLIAMQYLLNALLSIGLGCFDLLTYILCYII